MESGKPSVREVCRKHNPMHPVDGGMLRYFLDVEHLFTCRAWLTRAETRFIGLEEAAAKTNIVG
jgi:hypothetical protein